MGAMVFIFAFIVFIIIALHILCFVKIICELEILKENDLEQIA